MTNKKWKCFKCGKNYPVGENVVIEYLLKCPDCGDNLSLFFEEKFSWGKIDQRKNGVFRYLDLLPISSESADLLDNPQKPEFIAPISAPGLAARIGAKSVSLLACITGSGGTFKDVEAAVVIAKCLDWKLQNKRLSWHSTGNTARAYREYAIRGGFYSDSYFPLLCKNKWLGATENDCNKLIAYDGSFQEISEIAKKIAKGKEALHLAPFIWKIEGKAPIAYAIFEKLPETTIIVQTIAGGYGPLGITLGLNRLKDLSLIKDIPKFSMYQIEGADTISRLIPLNKEITVTDLKLPLNFFEPTLQSTNPLSTFKEIREMILSTNSDIKSVSVNEVLKSKDIFMEECKNLGLNISFEAEKSPFISWAGLVKSFKQGISYVNDNIVILITGSPERKGTIPQNFEIIKPQV